MSKLTRGQISKVALLAFGASVLTGCTGFKTTESAVEKRIYFSHSVDRTEKPDFSKQLSGTVKTEHSNIPNAQELLIYFDNDSSAIRNDDLERLQSFVIEYSRESAPVFLITGHTDSNNSDSYNIALSDRRAKATQIEMLKMGVPITQTALHGLGESTPTASNDNSEGRQFNRRVSVRAVD